MTYEAYNDEKLGFSTRQLHAGYNPADHFLSKAVPIYQSAAWELGDFDHAVNLMSFEDDGPSYSRYGNPTNDVLERRLVSLDGGRRAVSMASGMSAISSTFLALAQAGDNIVATRTLYGGSTKLLTHILPQYGIIGNFVDDPDNLAAFEAAIDRNTRALYMESIGNPQANIPDIEALAKIAHAHDIPLIIDNTFATPYLLRPIEWGADIVIYSTTKYLGGHGTVIGGVVVDAGRFDWIGNPKFPGINDFYEANKQFLGEEELKRDAFIRRLRLVYLTDIGGHMAPNTAFLVLQGIETLSLRMARHTENALAVAEFLEGHPAVEVVNYPGLPSSQHHKIALKYFGDGVTFAPHKGPGAMVSVRLAGGEVAARHVIERIRLFDFMVNIGDAKSMIAHNATSTHFGMTEEEQAAAGVYPGTLRLSIGLEDAEDLIADLEQALRSRN